MGLLRLLSFLWLVYMVGRFLRILLRSVPPNMPPRQNPFEAQGGRGWQPFEPPPREWYAPPPPPPPREPPRQAPRAEPTPYQVLGVSSQATREEIQKAYRAMIRQYHPDLVSNLGPELRELAEKRTKEITKAYNQLKRG